MAEQPTSQAAPRPASCAFAPRDTRSVRLAAVACMLAAGLLQLRLPEAGQTMHRRSDMDGHDRLMGIAREPGIGSVAGWFVGDDPQGVCSYRPLGAVMAWIGYHFWGFEWWPYVLLNWLWFVATGYVVYLLWREFGMPSLPAIACGAMALAVTTKATAATVPALGTLHDLMCVFFALTALVLMVRYLRSGRPGQLAWFALCSLMSCLSKESGLALLPLCTVVALGWHRVQPNRVRTARAVLVSVAVAAAWGALYVVAVSNMDRPGGAYHSMGGWLHMLTDRGWTTLLFGISNILPPVFVIIHMIRAGVGLLTYEVFWYEAGRLCVYVTSFAVLLRWRPGWLGLLLAWKAITYLPVLPFHDVWPWYMYMPGVLTPSLFVGALWCVWGRFRGGRRYAALLGAMPRRLQSVLPSARGPE